MKEEITPNVKKHNQSKMIYPLKSIPLCLLELSDKYRSK